MNKSNIKWYIIIFLILVILLTFFSAFIFHQPSFLYRPVRRFFSNHVHRTLNANDVNTIQYWMTFDYINKVFRLPPEYLKSTLNISDVHYPNLIIGRYAKEQEISRVDFLAKLREAVHGYLTPAK